MAAARRFSLQITFAFLVAVISIPARGENTPAREPLIAVLNAYAPEMEAMVKEFALDGPGFRQERVKGFRFYRGVVEGKQVLVVETGMSLVNAAMALQLTLDRFPVTHVLFAGVAGGTDPSLHVGDVVIPERWAYHGEAAYFNEDGKGGHIVADYFKPHYENFGMIYPDDVLAIRPGEDTFTRVPTFPADPHLLEVAKSAIAKMPPFRSTKTGRDLAISIGGTGVSGTVFLDNREYRKWVHRVWGARCLDMESVAYAHVCYTNQVPFLAVRALSDLAGGQDSGKNVIDDNEHASSLHAVRVLRAIIKEL